MIEEGESCGYVGGKHRGHAVVPRLASVFCFSENIEKFGLALVEEGVHFHDGACAGILELMGVKDSYAEYIWNSILEFGEKRHGVYCPYRESVEFLAVAAVEEAAECRGK